MWLPLAFAGLCWVNKLLRFKDNDQPLTHGGFLKGLLRKKENATELRCPPTGQNLTMWKRSLTTSLPVRWAFISLVVYKAREMHLNVHPHRILWVSLCELYTNAAQWNALTHAVVLASAKFIMQLRKTCHWKSDKWSLYLGPRFASHSVLPASILNAESPAKTPEKTPAATSLKQDITAKRTRRRH